MNFSPISEEDIALEEVDQVDLSVYTTRFLMLWNDNFNTFDHVIACLIRFAGKTPTESADIAWTVHTKGRCIIQEGAKSELVELYSVLKLKKLTVSIE